MGKKTKIDWCDSTWNPVTGCLHGCEYCYARGIANRFGFLKDDGKLHELNKPCTRDYYEDGEIVREDVKQPYPNGLLPHSIVTGWTSRSIGRIRARFLYAAWRTCLAIGCQTSG